MAYDKVNDAWPKEMPVLTAPEAITAAKRLYRKWAKKTMPYRVAFTTGNRYTRVRRGVLWINLDPPHGWNGWKQLVHTVSHYAHRRANPGIADHGPDHHLIEFEMVRHVVDSGWLDGKLRRPDKPKPAIDPKQVRYQAVLNRMTKWQAKERRAKTALRKLAKQKTYYEKAIAPELRA